MLSNFEATLGSETRVNKQVLHLLVVNLKDRNVDLERFGVTREFTATLEDLCAGDRHDSNVGSVPNLEEIKAYVSHFARFRIVVLTIEYDLPEPV